MVGIIPIDFTAAVERFVVVDKLVNDKEFGKVGQVDFLCPCAILLVPGVDAVVKVGKFIDEPLPVLPR